MSKTTDRPSNTSETECQKCLGRIAPHAGWRVSAYGSRYVHHAGQCIDRRELESDLHKLALQTTLFASSCRRINPDAKYDDMAVCEFSTTDRAAHVEHCRREHGAHPLKPSTPRIRLRKSVPVATREALPVKPCKSVLWTETHHGEWTAEHGQPSWTTSHRGQFWAMGSEANSVYVIEDLRQAGRPNRIVTLWLDGSGALVSSWSDAKHSRHDANQRKARAA
jgi:hypothetical protein